MSVRNFLGRNMKAAPLEATAGGGANSIGYGPEFEKLLVAYKGALSALEDFENRQKRLKIQIKETQAKGVSLATALEGARCVKDEALVKLAAGEVGQSVVASARSEVDRLEGAVRDNSEFLDAAERARYHNGATPDLEHSRLKAQVDSARKMFYQHVFEETAAEVRQLLKGRLSRAHALALLGGLRVHEVEHFANALFNWHTAPAKRGAFEAAWALAPVIEKEFLE